MKENLPIIVFLHGIDERGNNLSDIKRYSLPNYIDNMELPYVVLFPQCHENYFWDYHLRDVLNVLDDVIDTYKCDKDRVCIAGSSMGAVYSWSYIIQRPDVFKCLISSAGRCPFPVKKNLELIKDKSILMYHGTNDDIIDCKNSIELYDELKRIGAKDIELHLVENGNHFVCSEAYKDPYVYKWLSKKL